METVMVKYFESQSSIATLFGKLPKVKMLCGKCDSYFSKRFEPVDFKDGNPHVMCPHCKIINRVPILMYH